MDAAAAPAGYAQMPPPSPPPPTRPLATVDPNDMSTLTDAAARDLQIKREQLKLAMMELDLAERREKIATQQAERALAIKERELELAERERRLNPRPLPRPRPPPEPEPPKPNLAVSSELGVSIPPSNAVVGKKKLVMSSELSVDPSDPRAQSAPYVTAPSVREENRAENAPPEPAGQPVAPLPLPDLPPRVPMRGLARRPSPATAWATPPIPTPGRNQDINARLARMHSHKDHLKEEYLAKLDELDKQMAEAAIAQHKREVLAEKVAEQAVRDAKMTRVTQLAISSPRRWRW